MAKGRVASPGHKLGQVVGVLLQQALREPLMKFASRYNLYCDTQGERPGVRKGRKVTWRDSRGNTHDLDYVLERGGSATQRGDPVAFIEIAWRRYTKHSRNKAGELEGTLLPLRETYPSTRFVGAILAGRFSEGGIQQLRSAGIEVLYIPFETVCAAFESKGIRISYPEKASPEEKAALSQTLDLTDVQLADVAASLWDAIKDEYRAFEAKLTEAISRSPVQIRVVTLFGYEQVYPTIEAAIVALASEQEPSGIPTERKGYEVFIEFASGSEVKGRFMSKDELIDFLKQMV